MMHKQEDRWTDMTSTQDILYICKERLKENESTLVQWAPSFAWMSSYKYQIVSIILTELCKALTEQNKPFQRDSVEVI